MLKVICSSVVLSSVFLLSGCGGDSSSSSNNTQVVAKVNGEEITIHQLNQLLSTVKVPKGDYSKEEVEKKALDSLIEKTLVLQAAKKAKLDREPKVLSAVEEAKNKVLIDRYVQRTLETVAMPTDEQIKAFYDNFPELFADRKMYVFTKLAISAGPEKVDLIIDQVKDGKSIDDILKELDAQGITYKKMMEAKVEGKLPNPIMHFLSALQAGDIGYLKMTDGLLVVELHKLLDQSLSLEDAKEVIVRQLLLEERKKASLNLVNSLKEAAEIEYVGQFAPKK